MSLQDHTNIRFQGENGTEYTLIATPVGSSEGEVLHQAILQQVGNGLQGVDGNTQVLMLHPITVTTVDGIEHQILQDQQIGQILADGGLQIQTEGQVLQPEGHILQTEGQILQTDGQVLQADGQVLEGHMLSETSQAQIQALLQEANLASMNASSTSLTTCTSAASSVAYYTAPENICSSADGITTQTLMLQTADGQSFQAQVSIPQVAEPGITTVHPEPAVQPPLGKGPFHCEICAKVFTKWNQLQRHLRDHNDDKPFRCPDCPQTFNVSDNLRLHMATHSTDNPQCPECGKKFSRIASLKAHIMLHEKEESLMCAECGDEFALQGQLDRHMQEHLDEKEGLRVYSCRQCTVEFTQMARLREHMKQHYKVKNSLSHKTYKRNLDRTGFHHKCTHCSKTFQKPSQLIRHLRIHTGERPFRCDICEKRFNQKGALQIHMSKHTGDRPFSCQFCPATFSQKGNLRSHIQRLHSHPTSTDTPIFQCDECSCMFRKLGSLNAHLSRVHSDGGAGAVKIKDGSAEVGSIVVLKGGSEEKSGRNVQDVIQQLLELSDVVSDPQATQQQLQQIAVTENISSDILQQALENSGLAVQSVDGVQANANGSTTVGEAVEAAGSENQNGQIITLPTSSVGQGVLDKTGETSTMTVHDPATGTVKKHLIRKVNGIRLHQCTYCSKEFKKPSDLVRHIRIHTHERPYKCNQCFRSFAVKSTLMVHTRTHSGIKEFKCTVCNKMLSTNGSLKVHMRLHTGHKPFKCPHCDKWFRTSGHRKCHIASHFKDPSVPRKIRRNPNKKSKYEGNLADIPLPEPILITDTGMIQQAPRNNSFYNNYLGNGSSIDRPFKCTVCSRAFKKSSHLKQHIRSHTGERPYKCVMCMRSFVSSGVLKAHIRTHSGIKNYKCLMCDATFTTAGSLKRHTSTHSEVRPFMCPYCQKTFKTSVNCKKHMRTHRAELALQSLNQGALLDKDGQPQEVALITEVEVAADNVIEEDDDNTSDVGVGESIEIQAVGEDMVLSETEQSTNALTLQHQDLQANVIQEALVNDAQLGSTLNPQQVFGTQTLTQTYTQSLLSNSNQTFNQLDYTNIQTSTNNALDHSLTSFCQAESAPTTIVSTSMHNILQTKDPEELATDPVQEEAATSQQILRPRIQLEDNVEKPHKFVCHHCNRPFKKSSHLKQHIRSHTGEKPYACDQCRRTFVSNGVLKAHLKTHEGTKDFKCDVCGWTFSTKGSLTRHMMIHTSLKPFKCPFCNETFRTAFHCKKHMRNHREGENDGGEIAEDGSQVAPTKRSRSVVQISEEQAMELVNQNDQSDEQTALSLKLLMESAAEKNRISEAKDLLVVDEETHSSSRNKFPHQCTHCPKSFKKPSDLTRHVRIHTGEKPFGCASCGRTFTVKSTLDSHMRTHRALDKRFKCHMCNNAFSTKGSLKVHMRLHTGAKPFKCPHCDLRFRTSGHRKSHIALHFKESADGMVKKRKVNRQPEMKAGGQGVTLLNNPGLGQGQVITLDPSMFGGVMPIQLSVLDGGGLTANAEAGLGTQVLQGLEGLQLQVTANIGGQNIQISGLDPSVLTQTQTVQIDASLLQQLQQQQQGNINLAVNPNIITHAMQPGESNIVELQGTEMNSLLQQSAGQNITVNDVVSAVSHVQQVEESLNTSETAGIPENSVNADDQQSQQQALQTQVLTEGEVAEDDEDDDDDSDEENDGTVIAEGVTEETLKTLQQAGISLVNQDGTPVSVTTKDGNQQIIFTSGVSGNGKGPTQIVNVLPARDGERTHVCNKCGKSFKRPSHLREHMMTHDPNPAQRVKLAPHRCQTCQKAFTKPSQLERHIRIHTGERPFSCVICYRAFNQKNALQMHLKKHSGERPHQCPYCPHSFTQKGNLKTHIKRAHHVEMVQSMNLPKSTALDATMMVDVALAAAAAERDDEEEVEDVPQPAVADGSAGQEEGLDLEQVVEWLPN